MESVSMKKKPGFWNEETYFSHAKVWRLDTGESFEDEMKSYNFSYLKVQMTGCLKEQHAP